jgi:peptide/nickel transport system substrate-binding protein
MHKLYTAGVILAALALLVVAAASGSVDRATQSGTLVFAASSEPTSLDSPFISDGESLRATYQIYEGLLAQVPGTVTLAPKLATAWKSSPNGRTFTFTLRRGVRFHDGTPFNARAVCANFNRWYNFRGAQANPSASYYYNAIFKGFRTKDRGKALFRSCTAQGQYVAVIRLTRVYGPFLNVLTNGAFSMQSPAAMAKYGANKGRVTSEGVYTPTGQWGVPGGQAVGTGPFKLVSWRVGDKVEFARNDSYWGKKAGISRLIIRAIADNTARLQALQTGEIQGYDNVAPSDIATIRRNSKLKIANRPPFNVGYVGINQAVAPFNKLAVRKALAHALDRGAVVRSLYVGRGSVANEMQPPTLQFGYSNNVPTYPYNPNTAKQLLTQAGETQPVNVEFIYPTDVSRPYMPDPRRNFQAFSASLEQSGFKVTAKSAPWSPDYLGQVQAGTAGALFLLGWTGDYGDPTTFLDGIFAAKQFGLENALGNRFYAMIAKGAAEPNPLKRSAQYKAIQNFIMTNVLAVPYVHTRPALGFARNVQGFVASPVLNDSFASVRIAAG